MEEQSTTMLDIEKKIHQQKLEVLFDFVKRFCYI